MDQGKRMTGKRIGYIRVSTLDQNPDRQLEGVTLDKKFLDKASAGSLKRPQLTLMLDFIREDDIIMVHSMDRLARNVFDLRKTVDSIIHKGAQVHFIKEKLVFNGEDSPMSNLLLSVMGALAEFELSFIRERQREGIAIAKKQGRYKGKKKKLTATQVNLIHEKIQNTRESKSLIAKEFGISRETLYRYMNRHKICTTKADSE